MNHVRTKSAQPAPVYPANLFDCSELTETSNWWAVYTKSRQEKSLAKDLRGLGVQHFLPLIPSTTIYRRSRVSRQLPLFPGYLFLCGDEDDRVRCLTTNRVSRILEVKEPQQLLADLAQLHRLIESGAPLTAEDRLSPGARVRIRTGCLAGIEGVVVRRRSESRLLVSIHFLQQGASIAVDDFMIESIS